jgi:hypothetical protein
MRGSDGTINLTPTFTYHYDRWMVQNKGKAVAEFRPRIDQMEATIRAAAADTRNVMFGEHALDRMEERGITTLDALRVLRTGSVVGQPVPGQKVGEWKCKITQVIKGAREVGVVTIVMHNHRLFIKTVEWEDL